MVDNIKKAAEKACDQCGVTPRSEIRIFAEAVASNAIVAERERCAKILKDRREGYQEEHGIYDSTTDHTEYPGNGEEWVCEWEEIEEEIRLCQTDK